MSRNRGTLFTSSNFEPIVKAPLDARQKVQYYTDLTDPNAWEDFNGNTWLYKGTLVLVTEDPSSGLYWLNDPDNYTLTSSWTQVIAAPVVDVSVGVINVGDGSAAVYSITDASGFIHLRTISGKGQAVVYEDGDQIIIDVSVSGGGGSGTYDTTLDPALTMPNPVGGYPAGTDVSSLKGDSLIKMWDNLLFPTVDPTFDAPFNTFSDDQGPYEEIGASIDITFNATFDRGEILVSGNFQDFRSGLPNTYTYTGTGISGSVSSTSLSDSSILYGYTVLQGVQTWGSSVSYDAGPQPYDNKGNPFGSPLSAGSTGTQSVEFEGVYPLFGTTVNITTYTQRTPLSSMINGNNITFNMVSESLPNRQGFDVPDIWLASRPLAGVDYNDPILGWQPLLLTDWPSSATTHNIQGNTINYTRFNWNGVAVGAREIRIKF